MSKIRVNCPECRSQVVLEKALLAKTNGHAVCPECTHTFKLVKKAKSDKEPVKKTDKTATDKEQSVREMLADNKPPKSKPTRQLQGQKPLHYRIPKAAAKNTAFGEVGEGAFAFNLLDRDSVNRQLPVTLKPAGGSSITHAPMQQEGQQNHITIHTDSLVFTLVGDGQAPALPQTSMALAPMAANLPMAAQPAVMPVAAAPANETNWTIATIVALVILIIQLFNFILMLL